MSLAVHRWCCVGAICATAVASFGLVGCGQKAGLTLPVAAEATRASAPVGGAAKAASTGVAPSAADAASAATKAGR